MLHRKYLTRKTSFTLVLVNNNSSPRSVFHERTCPPCKLTWKSHTHNASINQIQKSGWGSWNWNRKSWENVTVAEAPRTFRRTTCSIPFLSLITSTDVILWSLSAPEWFISKIYFESNNSRKKKKLYLYFFLCF